MKKARATNTSGKPLKSVNAVYRVLDTKIKPTITKESAGSSSIYRNARGIVVWAGDDR